MVVIYLNINIFLDVVWWKSLVSFLYGGIDEQSRCSLPGALQTKDSFKSCIYGHIVHSEWRWPPEGFIFWSRKYWLSEQKEWRKKRRPSHNERRLSRCEIRLIAKARSDFFASLIVLNNNAKPWHTDRKFIRKL